MEQTGNIRLRRLQSVSQVMRMKDETLPKKALKEYIEGRRPGGMPSGRWL
jgi:hypothetical protein